MTKKNDSASGTKAPAARAGMKVGKKPRNVSRSAEAGRSVSMAQRVSSGDGGQMQPPPVSRGRLLARVTGAVTTGVQLMPDTEGLRSGLLLAALVLLAVDVLVDVGMSAIDLSGRLWRVLRTLRTSMRRESDGSFVAILRVGVPSVRRGRGLRVTGRLVSSLLIVGSTVVEGWHHELLVAALTTLVVDVVSESASLLSSYLRTKR
ncbi:hypothetical protein [Streptomyces sp. NPDC099088]|uniref:hypothetical protein n=1 Tax=Streptomyces sp. NPDC099088 TaxID=3366101 RepID=UPI0037F96A9C